jgi:hypothetical protein
MQIFSTNGSATSSCRNRYERRGVSKREWMKWILEARNKANKNSNIKSAWSATGLESFDPATVLKKLRRYKPCTSRPTTPKEQSNEPPFQPTITPHVTIQQGTLTLELPIDKIDELKQWISK